MGRPVNIVAEHHFLVKSGTSTFKLEAESLRPYQINRGSWRLRVLNFANEGELRGSSAFPKEFRIVSPNVTSPLSIPLTLISFGTAGHQGQCFVFDHSDYYCINHPSSVLLLELQSVDGNSTTITEHCYMTVALVQTSC